MVKETENVTTERNHLSSVEFENGIPKVISVGDSITYLETMKDTSTFCVPKEAKILQVEPYILISSHWGNSNAEFTKKVCWWQICQINDEVVTHQDNYPIFNTIAKTGLTVMFWHNDMICRGKITKIINSDLLYANITEYVGESFLSHEVRVHVDDTVMIDKIKVRQGHYILYEKVRALRYQ